jgi:hypothetical protein
MFVPESPKSRSGSNCSPWNGLFPQRNTKRGIVEAEFLHNAAQWLAQSPKTALTESNVPQPPNHGFLHCSSMAKTIDRTKNPYPSKTMVETIKRRKMVIIK